METNIGSKGKLEAEFVGGQLVVSASYDEGDLGSTQVVQKVNAKAVLDALGKLGTIEKQIVDIVEAAILPAPVAAPAADAVAAPSA